MSRSPYARTPDELERDNTRLREALAETRGELAGLRRGENTVAQQLARDIRLGTLREEQHRTTAARAYADVQAVLRSVAAHLLDLRGGVDGATAAEILAEELTAAGVPLRNAFIAVQVERADSAAQVSASEAAAAVASAP